MTRNENPMLQLFDTHAHLDIPPLCSSVNTILEQLKTGKIPEKVQKIADFQLQGILIPGTDLQSSRKVIEIAQLSEKTYAAVAIHPNAVFEAHESDWEQLVVLSEHPKVVAIGETGLDRYWDKTPFEQQIEYFHRHLDLAVNRNLPVLIHSRDCDDDMIHVLKNRKNLQGVIHSFSSNSETVKQFLEMGLYISFSGSLTYTNKKFAPLWEAATAVPDDRLLVETDSPYLTPHPYRGKIDFNEPTMVGFVVKRLAELRNQTLEHVSKITTDNARKMLQIQ